MNSFNFVYFTVFDFFRPLWFIVLMLAIYVLCILGVCILSGTKFFKSNFIMGIFNFLQFQ